MRKLTKLWEGAAPLLAMLLCAGQANAQSDALGPGQGFMVKPMRMETMALAGQAVDVPLQIRNIAESGPIVVNLRLVELSETLDGGWRLIEPDSSENTADLLSARAWTGLSTDSVTVAPLAPAEVTAHVKSPASARGVYFAGVIAETPPPPKDTKGISIRVRFLVPLIVNIQGRPVRQQVVLDDVLMGSKNEPNVAPTTTAALRIVNKGRTFSRVRGTLRIERESKGVWRPVTSVDVAERGIIPGVTLELGDELHRSLPSGTYRVKGDLYVDGRRVKPIEKEIAFTGDPAADRLAYDTTLTLSPQVVKMNVTPGATRATVVRIENPGDDPVNVTIGAAMPRGLAGVELGTIQGSDYSAAAWTEVRPSQFTIQPGRWQNVRVISNVPADGATNPDYYADLILDGTYPDGQSAGETRSTVQLVNSAGKAAAAGAIEQLQLAEGEEPAKFVVQMRFANTGNVDVTPTARAFVLDAQGRSMRSTSLAGDDGLLLPLGKRTFSGDLDLAGLDPGYYALRSDVTLDPGNQVTTQRVLRIEAGAPDAEGKATAPIITVLDAAAVELPGDGSLPADGG
jgi:hypothetical protein